MAEAEVRRDLQKGFEDVLRHILFYGEVVLLRTTDMEKVKTLNRIVEEALKIVEGERVRLKESEKNVLDEAREKGRMEGIREFKDIIKNLIDEKERLFKKIEDTLLERIILISEKVLEQELLINPSSILSIIREEIKRVCGENITVVLNEAVVKEIMEVSPEFFEEMEARHVSVAGREEIKRGECLIECKSGEIDLSVGRRLKKMERILKNGT